MSGGCREKVDTIRSELLRSGWVLLRRRKHYRYRSPDGFAITIPFSPSDWRVPENIVRDLRRMARDGCAHVPKRFLPRAKEKMG